MKQKQIDPDFKQVKLEFSLNVEESGRMRVDGSIRLNGKAVSMDKYSNAQLFALYTLFENAVPAYYSACVDLCLKRGIVRLADDKENNTNIGEA